MTTRQRNHYYSEDLELKFAAVDPAWALPVPGLPNPAWAPIVNIRDVTTGLYYDAAGPPFWVAGAAPGLPDNPMAPADVAEAPFDAFFTLTITAAQLGTGGVGPDLEVIYEDAVVPAAPQTEMEHIHLIHEQKSRYTRRHDRSKDLIFTLSQVVGATPQTTLLPDILIRRSSDNQYWTGAAWGAAAWQVMTELDAVNSPGIYVYLALTAADLDASDTLYVSYRNTTNPAYPLYENEQVILHNNTWDELIATYNTAGTFGLTAQSAAADVWDELETAHTVAGSFGQAVTRAFSLLFRWYREFDHVYNAGGQLTQVKIRTYESAAQYGADAAPAHPPTPAGSMTLQYDITYTNNRPSASDCTVLP